MIRSEKRKEFEKIYIKHIEIKSISSKNVYKKNIKVYVYVGILIKNGENQYLDLLSFLIML